MRLLLVEDDKFLADAVASILEEEGYDVDSADNGTEGLLMAQQGIYDVIVLDLMLPGMDGLSVLRAIRGKADTTPVLILTARDSVEARVKGLDVGADDYLVKPFAIDELLARIRSLIRRTKGIGVSGELVYGAIVLPSGEHEAYCSGQALQLTAKEYELLSYMVQHKGQILRREQMLNRVWGMDSETNDTSVDLYIHYLRKKLSACGCGSYIRTVRGVGYMLKAGQDDV